MSKRLTTAQKRINDHQRLHMFIATNDVRSLRRLLWGALRRRASVPAILNLIQRSLDGNYNPRSQFSDRDLAIGFLAKSLGGPRLLYALSKADKYPSVSTVAQKFRIPSLIPSVSTPSRQEIYDNIAMFFGPKAPQHPDPCARLLPGLIIMIDGVAINECCRYDALRDYILGLCREHSHRVNKSVRTYANVEAVSKALHQDKTCCYGKDGTVVAIGPYADSEHYTPIAIVVSPSCKKETADELLIWIELILDVWRTHPDGECKHGPIWTVGSDGESSFRKMRMSMCMTDSIDVHSDLGRVLVKLPGLNTKVSKHDTGSTCDPKHVMKSKWSVFYSQSQ